MADDLLERLRLHALSSVVDLSPAECAAIVRMVEREREVGARLRDLVFAVEPLLLAFASEREHRVTGEQVQALETAYVRAFAEMGRPR